MAKIDAAFGLRPYERSGSNYNNQGVNAYPINFEGSSSGTTSLIWTGSPVIPLASGLIDIVGAAAGGTVPLLGVFMGCKYTDPNLGYELYSQSYPAGTVASDIQAYVADATDLLFKTADVSSGTTIVKSAVEDVTGKALGKEF